MEDFVFTTVGTQWLAILAAMYLLVSFIVTPVALTVRRK